MLETAALTKRLQAVHGTTNRPLFVHRLQFVEFLSFPFVVVVVETRSNICAGILASC